MSSGTVGETRDHVDGTRRQIPGLDHRDARPLQAAAHAARVRHAGKHETVDAAPEKRLHQRGLLLEPVPRLPEQQLVAMPCQRLRQAVDGVRKDRVGDGRHDDCHDARAVGGQTAGGEVGQVAQPLDRGPDGAQGGRRELVRRIERARDGNRRHPRRARDVFHAHGLGVRPPMAGSGGYGARSPDAAWRLTSAASLATMGVSANILTPRSGKWRAGERKPWRTSTPTPSPGTSGTA